MKLTINLEDFWLSGEYDSESVANLIRDVATEEIRVKLAAAKAINQDWRKVADMLAEMEAT